MSRRSNHPPTVRQLAQAFISSDDGKSESTREKHQQALGHVIEAWGRRRITSLTVADAKTLASKIKKSGLAQTTAAKRLQTIKSWGQWLVDAEYIESNPFASTNPGSGRVDATKKRFVTLEEFNSVLATIEDPEWRCVFVLARYCGLRIPSEICSLYWFDVLWDSQQIRINKAKTEPRFCPLFRPVERELKALKTTLESLETDSPLVFGRWQLNLESNLRTQINRFVKRAGCNPWPRTFHNQRASRCTELIYDKGFSHKETSQYMGNSPNVIMDHYEVSRPDHFKKLLEEE